MTGSLAANASCLDASLAAIALAAVSGVPGLTLGRRSPVGQRIASFLLLAGTLLGLGAALVALKEASVETARIAGALAHLPLRLRLDPLAAFFLVPVYVLGAAGTLYGTRYWSQVEHPENGRRLRLWFGLLIASLAGVMLAADAIAFLFAWEIMAISAFLLVTTEDDSAEVRQAGWVYLVTAHVGVLALFALFGLLWAASGSLEFQPLASGAAGRGTSAALFLLALLAFGLKAGIVPLHFWLPAAHASAPSHVSALLSGIVLKTGIYGLLRISMLLPPPPSAVGMLLLALGALSAVYGVLFALGQHDLKRLLAYHSVENIGIIVMGLGLALIGLSARQPAWVALGLAGCLLHVWNHALFKSLLFLAAGSVIRGAGVREIDRLGGLGRSMGSTSALFAIGAAAICGLPPLNGFVSELMIFIGLLRIGTDGVDGVWSVAPLAAPLLAMAGALAVACFVKVFGSVFLGPSRSEGALRAHESPPGMLLAMLLLALGCIAIGTLPVLVIPVLDPVVGAWARMETPPPSLAELLPWRPLMAANGVLVAGVCAAALLLRQRSRRRVPALAVTWDCGYANPQPSMAYTASSFAQILVGLYAWLLRPRTAKGVSSEVFPLARSFHATVPEQVIDGVLTPFWAGFRRRLGPLRVVQQGRIQQYLVYVLLTLCVLLASLFPIGRILARFFGW
jgi:hydrogenase-4 component B